MNPLKHQIESLAIGFYLMLGAALAAHALDNKFTYQGRLTDNSSPATASYQIQFRLRDGPSDASAVLATAPLQTVSVVDGLFSAPVDFPVVLFDGNDRWLEISVATPATPGAFTVLLPRQKITPTPYALYAAKAGMLEEAANQVFTGTVAFNPTTLLPPFQVGSSVKVQNLNADLIDGKDASEFSLKADQCVANLAELKSKSPGFTRCVSVLGYALPGDGGGGLFFWDASASQPNHSGIIVTPDSNPSIGRWKRLAKGPLSVKWFGAIGDGISHPLSERYSSLQAAQADYPTLLSLELSDEIDWAAIQAALNVATAAGGGSVAFESGRHYKIGKTLLIASYFVEILGASAQVDYSGTGVAIDAVPILGANPYPNYPAGFRLNNLQLVLRTPGATGVRWRFSYSQAVDVSIALTAADQVGWELAGDVHGTGPYNNTFKDCGVQGHTPAVTGQTGWLFTYDSSAPARCPNANLFLHGRTGQVDVGWRINGTKNVLDSVVCEGITLNVFVVDNAASPDGAASNTIKDPYVEGAAGVTVFRLGTNALDTAILNPSVTSIEGGTTFADSGRRTIISSLRKSSVPAEGLVFTQDNVAHNPTVTGEYPGLVLTDARNHVAINLRNSSQYNLGSHMLSVDDGTSVNWIFNVGPMEGQFQAPTLKLANGAVGIHSGAGPPGFSAPNASLYLRTDGGAGSTFYVRESGTWVAK